MTGHRIKVLCAIWFVFMPYQVFTALCLLLDNVLFPGWRKVNVDHSVFITGLFRSGTTFLFRLMAADRDHFSAMRTWEMYVAPSILQRKMFHWAKKVDALFGGPLIKIVRNLNYRMSARGQFHKIGIWEEEEDEGLFLHLWDAFFTWFFVPDYRGVEDYTFPDTSANQRRQVRRMIFYRTCIQRHMYAHPESALYLSKNPSFSPRLDILRQVFPGARILYMIRDPLDVLPSQMGWFSFCWKFFATPREEYPFKQEVLAMTRHWYVQPLDLLEGWDDQDYRILEFGDVTGKTREVLEKVCSYIGVPLSEETLARLDARNTGSGKFNNRKNIRVEDIGWKEQDIRNQFDDVYRRFDFTHTVRKQ